MMRQISLLCTAQLSTAEKYASTPIGGCRGDFSQWRSRPVRLMMEARAGTRELPMRRSLSYADAAKMLGGGDVALVKLLDRLSAFGLFSVPGIDLVAACRELVRAGDELLTRFGERLRGVDRMTRTERLRAAHAIIVLTAYFDTR
jgi:hypothetical protein